VTGDGLGGRVGLVGLVRDSLVTAESGKYGEVMTMKGELVDEVTEDVVLQVVIRSPGFTEGGTLVGLVKIRPLVE